MRSEATAPASMGPPRSRSHGMCRSPTERTPAPRETDDTGQHRDRDRSLIPISATRRRRSDSATGHCPSDQTAE
jgi:hypothetical protein